MEKAYKLMTEPELTKIREIFEQVGNDPKYSVIKKLYGYIKQNGAIREDVYAYLLENMFFEDYSLLILNNLIKTFAGPEWFDLIKKTEERGNENNAAQGNIRLFQQLVLEAYRENVPYPYVLDAMEQARYPYEVNQRLEQFHKAKHDDMEEVFSGLKAVMEELKKDREEYAKQSERLSELLKVREEAMKAPGDKEEKNSLIAPAPKEMEEPACKDSGTDEFVTAAERYDEEPAPKTPEAFAEPEENAVMPEIKEFLDGIRRENELQLNEMRSMLLRMQELFTGMCRSIPQENIVSMPVQEDEMKPGHFKVAEETKVSEGEEVVSPKEKEPAIKIPSIGNGKDKKILPETKSGTLVTEIKNHREAMRRVSFFTMIRDRKRKNAFEKLTNRKKAEELFKMMAERNYTDQMMVSVKKCLELGVSFEFLYAFIEMDAGEEEFRKLILFRDTEKKEAGRRTETANLAQEESNEDTDTSGFNTLEGEDADGE